MNCKQGDLAIVVRANIKANLGKIVEVLRPSPEGEVFTSVCTVKRVRLFTERWGPDTWAVQAVGNAILWGSKTGGADLYEFKEAPFRDWQLQPLPKLDEPESTTTEKELTV